ncbi:MAG: LON peptidase substrate-binding domain-containing protein [Gemmatimonadota bacterium]
MSLTLIGEWRVRRISVTFRSRPTPTGSAEIVMRSTTVLIALLFLPGLLKAQEDPVAGSGLPASIPIFPLPDVSLFPHVAQPFHIFEARYRDMVADALAGDSVIGMVTLQPGFEPDYEGRPPIYALGSAGRIVQSEQLPDGRYNIVLDGFTKFRVLTEDASRSYRLAEVEELPEPIAEADRAVLAERRQQLEEALLAAIPDVQLPPAEMADEQVIDLLSLAIPMHPEERMDLLEASGPAERALILIRRLRGGPRSSI